jgi:hypothetical protein
MAVFYALHPTTCILFYARLKHDTVAYDERPIPNNDPIDSSRHKGVHYPFNPFDLLHFDIDIACSRSYIDIT